MWLIRYISVITGLALFMSLSYGYNKTVRLDEYPLKTQTESEEIVEMEKNIQLIMDAGDIDQDSAEGTVEILLDLGVSSLKNVELISRTHGIVLCAVDSEGNTYYLGFGEFGYLEIIRKDSEDGVVIYAPEE